MATANARLLTSTGLKLELLVFLIPRSRWDAGTKAWNERSGCGAEFSRRYLNSAYISFLKRMSYSAISFPRLLPEQDFAEGLCITTWSKSAMMPKNANWLGNVGNHGQMAWIRLKKKAWLQIWSRKSHDRWYKNTTCADGEQSTAR